MLRIGLIVLNISALWLWICCIVCYLVISLFLFYVFVCLYLLMCVFVLFTYCIVTVVWVD